MKNFRIESTSKTPTVDFKLDSGELLVSGISVPENAVEFYTPVVGWLINYAANPQHKTVLSLKLTYLNTSSLQFLYDALKELDEISVPDSVIINWYYAEDDDDMKETGEDFKEVTSAEFNFIEVDEL
tara:strand:- start:4428 stop:4808 length:381 start_codon:yes stop_codon:yes gene_type:complete